MSAQNPPERPWNELDRLRCLREVELDLAAQGYKPADASDLARLAQEWVEEMFPMNPDGTKPR